MMTDKEKSLRDRCNKILEHPSKEEIIKRLTNGDSVKSIETWIKKAHRNKRYHVSLMTLQKFRKDVLQLDGEVLSDIKAAKREYDMQVTEDEMKEKLSKSNAYQQTLQSIVSKELDTHQKILESVVLISSRLEHYFNVVSTQPDLRKDKMLIELLNVQRGWIQDYEKYVKGTADKKIEHNVHIEIVNEQVTVMKNIIFDVLREMSPELIPVFIDNINKRINDTEYGTDIYNSYNNNHRLLDIIDG